MRFRTSLTFTSAILVAGLALSACGVSADEDSSSAGGSTAAAGPVTGLRILVPNSPGSGYDQTARAAAKAMQDAKLANTIEVFNAAGAGGTVGLQRLVNEKGAEDLLMQMGLGVVGAVYTNKSKATLNDTVPIAKLIEESEAIVVPKDSPYTTLDQLVAAWKADPGKLPVGGASNPGGPDHLTPMLLAKAVGVTPEGRQLRRLRRWRRAAHRRARQQGRLRRHRHQRGRRAGQERRREDPRRDERRPGRGHRRPDPQEPRRRHGVHQLARHRGAPRPLGAEKTAQYVDLLTKMHASEQWKKTLADQGWTDAFQTGDEFKAYLTAQNESVAGVLKELGLTS